MRECDLVFGIQIARKLDRLFPFSILILVAHTPEIPYPSLLIFTPAAGSHGLWPWMNAPTFGRDVAPHGR
jgi:hypothetical protein